MIRMELTNAVVSQGYNGAPAISITESGETKIARFKVGATVYDKNADKNRRYINFTIKGFNGMCARIEGMKLDAGAYVNVVGRFDLDTWEDKNTHEKKFDLVLTADEIEYCYGGANKQNSEVGGAPATTGQSHTPPPVAGNQPPENFTGFEGFGGANPFFPES